MKRQKRVAGLLLLLLVILAGKTVKVNAADYTWKTAPNGERQCYKNGRLVKNEWVGNRHLNKQGYLDRNKWLTREMDGLKIRGFAREDGKWIKNFKEGWQEIKGEYYYYKDSGEMVTGWLKVGKKKYYIDKTTKTRVTGIYAVKGKLYYFSSNGVMQKDKTVKYAGRKYVIDEKGVCTLKKSTDAPSEDMLFFLQFESGSEAYKQTGGDHGNACGAYQFDNRYSLLPFVKYAYAKNSELCAEFKNYAKYTNGTKLKSNEGFFKAWRKVYARNPQLFAELQDKFAKENYYDPVEKTLSRAGIDLGTRSDVVKGAVYSYSIQHGQTTAVNAVKACGIKQSTTDAQFLKKLYQRRMSSFPRYRNRYAQEYSLAKQRLKKAE